MPQTTAPEYDLRDHLTAGRESWRPQRPPATINPQLKRIAVIIAGVLSFGAFCGVVTSSLIRHSHVVPIIEADPRPIRVKPADPGGMQFAGSDELGADDGSRVNDVVMPPPEDPKVDALHQQIQAARPSPPPPVAAIDPPPVVVPAPAATPAPPVVQAAPAPRPPTPMAPQAAPVTSPGFATQLSSKTQVQLAAMTTNNGAVEEWRRLSKRMPELLGNRQPAIIRTERDGKTFFRLRVGGFADTLAADLFCTQVRLKGGVCAVATF